LSFITIIIIIIIIIVFVVFVFVVVAVVDSLTLLNIRPLGNLRLSQTVSGIKLGQGKEIRPIP
jgi:hypothetical protein